jgi:hypothetical protein
MIIDRTATSIANMAADFLDATPVANLDEDFGAAKIYKRNYDEAVATVLAEFPWLSATTRATVTPIQVDETLLRGTRYMSAYPWPVDCITPRDFNGRPAEDVRYESETIAVVDGHGNIMSRRKVILADLTGPVVLRYGCAVNPRDMTPHLAKAVALELAMRCEAPIANSSSRGERLSRMYRETTTGADGRRGGFVIDTKANRPEQRRRLQTDLEAIRAGGR